MPPLDLSLPLELDDGTPVQFVDKTSGGYFRAKTPKYARNSVAYDGLWSYDLDGTFAGGTRKNYYYIRNAAPAAPEEYEGWFV